MYVGPPCPRLVALLLSFGPICHNVCWGKRYGAVERGARMHLWHAQFVTGEGKGQFLGRPANLGRSTAVPHLMGNRVPCFLPKASNSSLRKRSKVFETFLTVNIFDGHLPLPSAQGRSFLSNMANIKLSFSEKPRDFLIYWVSWKFKCRYYCLFFLVSRM